MRKSGRANLDAMLRHLASHNDPQDFPSTAYERQALLEAAGKRRLIEWQKDNRRYELTPIGWRRLRRNRGVIFSLGIGAGLAATVGAAALAMLWLPGDRSPHEKSVASPQAKKVGVLAPAPPAAGPSPIVPAALRESAPGAAPNPPAQAATTVDRPAEPARVAEPPAEPARTVDRPAEPARTADRGAEPAQRPAEPGTAAEQPAAPPDGDAGGTAAKEPAAKRSRHHASRAHRRWRWGFGHYRDERYAGRLSR